MSATPAPSFEEFFAEANRGRLPFPWQRRLAEHLVSGTVPEWITVPTGLGKTAIVDCWLYALIRSIADDGSRRSVPTRLIFVVNRRGIVDDATTRSAAIASALESDTPAMRWARSVLLTAGHALERPLEVVRMRGGVTWDWLWLRQPDQPAVVASTVDQFGSRLLFRGYGVGDRYLSIDAALVSNDALVVLDEAHLSQPLVETIERVQQLQAQAAEPVFANRRMVLTKMTATPPVLPVVAKAAAPSVIEVDQEDDADPVAGPRLRAVKLIHPVVVDSDKRKSDETVTVAAALAATTLLERVRNEAPAAIVIMNTVGAARAVFDRIRNGADVDACLLVGSVRPWERAAIETIWRERISSGRDRTAQRRPFVLVATQTVEVGADIDADVLVTEACALDALTQRLGRLDRLGERTTVEGHAEGVVLFNEHRHADQAKASFGIYEQAAAKVFELVSAWAGGSPLHTDAKRAFELTDSVPVDLGPLALADRLAFGVRRSELLRSPTHAPVLLPTAVRGWAQTSPRPVPDRPVAPYLHGPGRGDSDIVVVWRDLQDPCAVELLEALSPIAEESVTLRRWEVLRFLIERAPAASDDDGDVDNAVVDVELPRRLRARVRFAFAVDGEWSILEPGTPLDAGVLDLLPTVVVDVAAGGHDEWSWSAGSDVRVDDVADVAGGFEKRPLVVSTRRLRALGLPDADELSESILRSVDQEDRSAISEGLGAVAHACRSSAELSGSRARRRFADRIDAGVRILRLMHAENVDADGRPLLLPVLLLLPDSTRGVTGREQAVVAPVDPSMLAINDDGPDATSRTALPGASVTLRSHLTDVGDRCAALARASGVEERLGELCALAARLHDLGKADRRFQTLLRNGDWVAAELESSDSGVLAKSSPGPRLSSSDLPAEFRWPRGLRHEALSRLMLLDSSQWHGDLSEEERSLVLHLVGAHHGFYRPLFPAVTDGGPSDVSFLFEGRGYATGGRPSSIDWDHPRTFTELNERYSPWGLAMLEALVRFADFWVSSEGR